MDCIQNTTPVTQTDEREKKILENRYFSPTRPICSNDKIHIHDSTEAITVECLQMPKRK